MQTGASVCTAPWLSLLACANGYDMAQLGCKGIDPAFTRRTRPATLVTVTAAPSRPSAAEVLGEQFLTTKEVAGLFQVAEKTIRDWITRGEILAVRFGKAYYISETALRESKQIKEERARVELLQRRRAQELDIELGRRREREPDLGWELTRCVICGGNAVLSSRHSRYEG